MAADDEESTFFRKPSCILWTATSLVIIYAVWCLLLLILTGSGHLLNSQSFECVNSQEDVARLINQAKLVYLGSGLSLAACALLLLEVWRKKGFYLKMLIGTTCCLLLVLVIYTVNLSDEETQKLREFENRTLALLPLTDKRPNTPNQLNDTVCPTIHNVYRWQDEFKCCGLQGYQDWKSPIPDSCLCDREDSSGCVGVGDSVVYEKPCLPMVLSLVEKRSSTFWTIMAVWITIVSVVPALFVYCMLVISLYLFAQLIKLEVCLKKLNDWINERRGIEKMVPVVFIRKNNNNETYEDNQEDGEAKESSEVNGVVLHQKEGTNVQGEGREAVEDEPDDNVVTIIPLSEVRRLQEQTDPPPVKHSVHCMCLFPSKLEDLYIVLLEEGSPLLPRNAVLVDPNKRTGTAWWCYGPHNFTVEHVIWP